MKKIFFKFVEIKNHQKAKMDLVKLIFTLLITFLLGWAALWLWRKDTTVYRIIGVALGVIAAVVFFGGIGAALSNKEVVVIPGISSVSGKYVY